MRNRVFIVITFIICLFWLSPTGDFATENHRTTIAMCRPSTGQIKNIVVLKNVGMLDVKDLKLLCVYHEDELTDYNDSMSYVKKNNLGWIEFVKIIGKVKRDELFKKNIWTSQFRAVFNNSDGIIFTGGMDIPPAIYGEKNSLLTVATTPIRTYYEASFLFHLIGGSNNRSFIPFLESRKKYPVLGICLGEQTMNVAAGGTLFQDIPSEIYGFKTVEQVLKAGREKIHSSIYKKLICPERKEIISPAFHSIKYTKNSILLKTFFLEGEKFPLILSSHHQSVRKVGFNLVVAARSIDGKVIEALEHKKYKNVLGIQFHPELSLLYEGVKLFTDNPDKGDFYTLKDFVKKNRSMFFFHKKLWGWFSSSIKQMTGNNGE